MQTVFAMSMWLWEVFVTTWTSSFGISDYGLLGRFGSAHPLLMTK